MVAAGWHAVAGLDVPPSPWLAHAQALLCVTMIDQATQIAAVTELLTRGISVAVGCTSVDLAKDVFDQGRRLAPAEWYDRTQPPLTVGLDATHIALLLRVRAGDDVDAAARHCHVSLRTAARRLSEAREVLGARTTTAAALALGARVDALAQIS